MSRKPSSRALLFRVTLDSEDALQGFLMINATVEGIEETAEGLIRVFLPEAEWNARFETTLRDFLATLPANAAELLSSESIEDRDWNAEWEESIEPVAATKELVITPSWKLDDAALLKLPYQIIIDPKMSFGTGHHETTRLCLRALEMISVESAAVLDLGTGSGVLAMYALLRGAKRAVGVDTDQWAVENVVENRSLNGFDDHNFEVRLGDLSTAVKPEEIFDLIFANIHRNILLDVAHSLSLHSREASHLILSGILEYDTVEVRACYEGKGYLLVEELREKEWAALLLRRLPT